MLTARAWERFSRKCYAHSEGVGEVLPEVAQDDDDQLALRHVSEASRQVHTPTLHQVQGFCEGHLRKRETSH